MWLRRTGEPRHPLADFDAAILHAIASGALGAIDWRVSEHDWETPVALGDDGASLRIPAAVGAPATAAAPVTVLARLDVVAPWFEGLHDTLAYSIHAYV